MALLVSEPLRAGRRTPRRSRCLLGADGAHGDRLRADDPGGQRAGGGAVSRAGSTWRSWRSTPCSVWARRWRRSSSPCSSGSATWWGLPLTVGGLLAALIVWSAVAAARRRQATADVGERRANREAFVRASSGCSRRSRSATAIVETLNGNWAILYMKGVLQRPGRAGRGRADAVLGGGDRGPRALRRDRALALRPAAPFGCSRG